MKIDDIREPQQIWKPVSGQPYQFSVSEEDIEERTVNNNGKEFKRYILKIIVNEDGKLNEHELSLPITALYQMKLQLQAKKINKLTGTKWLLIKTGEGLNTKWTLSLQ